MQNAHARKSQVQKKLIAAVAMLLVSCVLVVNSTYAWFTLSTAPELTGISTSVGANGNLEMALLTTDTFANMSTIGSGVGDSMNIASVIQANKTWGNLVSMKDNTGADAYHLANIVLKPSRLNVSNITSIDSVTGETIYKINPGTPLQTPSYGDDGRVASLSANTLTGGWSGNGFAYNSDRGVIAVGTASAMTPGQQAIRSALASMSTNMTGAIDTAQAAVKMYGGDLADIAIKHALAAEGADTYDYQEMQVVVDTVNKVISAVAKVEIALKNAFIVLANNQADLGGVALTTDNIIFEIPAAEEVAVNSSLLPVVKYNLNGTQYALTLDNDYLKTALFDYRDLKAAATTAQTKVSELLTSKSAVEGKIPETVADVNDVDSDSNIEEMIANTATWDEISPCINGIMDSSKIKVNNMAISAIKTNTQDFIDSVTANGMKLVMDLAPGSGLFADIAEFCGDYSATVTISEVTYNGLTVKNVAATMQTSVLENDSNAHLNLIYNAVKGATAKDTEGGTQTSAAITDYYGYMIDLAFRTNAASSNLLLQTAEAQRIYEDSTNTATQGGGSYMMFSASLGLTDNQMIELMEALRVVFINPTTGEIYGIATVDTEKLTTSAEGTKGYLYLRNFTFGATGSVQDTLGMLSITNRFLTVAEMTTAQKQAVDSTYTEGGVFAYADHDAYLAANSSVENFVDNWATTTLASDTALMELQQNTPKAMSALVYLDGDYVDNAAVNNGELAMTGSLNLQFASDAKLTPMENTELEEG